MTIEEYIKTTFEIVENYVLTKDFGPYISVQDAYYQALELGLINKFKYDHYYDNIEYEFAKIGISDYEKFITGENVE